MIKGRCHDVVVCVGASRIRCFRKYGRSKINSIGLTFYLSFYCIRFTNNLCYFTAVNTVEIHKDELRERIGKCNDLRNHHIHSGSPFENDD